MRGLAGNNDGLYRTKDKAKLLRNNINKEGQDDHGGKQRTKVFSRIYKKEHCGSREQYWPRIYKKEHCGSREQYWPKHLQERKGLHILYTVQYTQPYPFNAHLA